MAIRKTESRKITVVGVRYLWRIRKRLTYCQGNAWKGMTVAIQQADESGTVLLVKTGQARNWMQGPAFPVAPGTVRRFIQLALSQGWQPTRPGIPFELDG